jgi:protein O-mannosyl-transferase
MTQTPGIRQQRSHPLGNVIMVTALLALASLVYSPVRHFGFIDFDDPGYVSQNALVKQGLSRESLHYAFTDSVMANWTPLVWLSFMLDGQLLHAAPGPIHLENAAWHAAAAILLYFLLANATGSFWRSGLVSAVFVVHPMHVESVAWIAERRDVLSTPLLLGAMLAYCRYTRASGKWCSAAWYALMLLLFALSLMSKATGVTLPALLLLLDFWPFERIRLDRFDVRRSIRLLLEKLPVAMMSVGLAVLTVWAQQHAGAVKAVATLPMSDRLKNAIVCYVIYLAKLVWPTDLAIYYPHPGTRPLSVVCCAAGLVGLIIWLAWRLRQQMPWILAGLLWFLIALLPMIGLVQLGGLAMADRYSYLPSIGLFIAVVWTAGELLRSSAVFRYTRIGIAAVILILLTFLGRRQVWYWQDTETVFARDYAVVGPNPVACFFMGKAAETRGDTQAAIDYLLQAVEQDPGNARVFEILGNLFLKVDLTRAVVCYQRAVDLEPTRIDYRIALAVALTDTNNRPSLINAGQQLQQVLQLDPHNAQATAGLQDITTRLQTLPP